MSLHANHASLRSAAPVRIAAISLGVTAGLLAIKIVLGLISQSIAVLGDAVDSGTDLTAGAAALISVRIASWPADEDHPYGHGKVEALSAAVAATIIAVGGGLVVFQAVRRLITGIPDIDVTTGLVAMVISAGANIVMAFFMRREARRSGSMALKAEATHLQTNVVQAGGIIAGLAMVAITGLKLFDPLVALGLATYMGITAVGLVRTAVSEIMDEALPVQELSVIHDVLVSHREEIRGFHQLRSRRVGHIRHVDMHLVIDSDKPFQEVHRIGDQIEHEIQARLPGAIVVIHLEPAGEEGQALDRLEGRVPTPSD